MILLTAFSGYNNSSRILVDMVNVDNVNKVLFTNDFDVSKREMIEALSYVLPNYVISFGRKPLINRLYIEPVARINNSCIYTNFDISLLKDSLKSFDLQFKISSKPGNYLCNSVYYHGLNFVEKNKQETKMIFIHAPDMKKFKNIELVAAWLNKFCSELK